MRPSTLRQAQGTAGSGRRLLAVDIGAGTQDILVFDSSLPLEGCVKLVLPSPTQLVAGRIRAARGRPLFLAGTTMGGGPNGMALRRHLEKGGKAYATAEAARTFNDDLKEVESWGVVLVSEEEGARLQGVLRLELRDLDLAALGRALEAFDIPARFDGVAVALLDHGAAPPEVSDRIFRFQHLRRSLEKRDDLLAFAYLSQEVPSYLTRMTALAETLQNQEGPLLLMDTAAAAALGALEDDGVRGHRQRVLVNVGNSHTLAFRLSEHHILGFFEHHTFLLDGPAIDQLILKLAEGNLTQEEVFDEGGHGCYILKKGSGKPFLSVTGPQRWRMQSSPLKPYFVAPHGDMMLAGCFGLLRAFASKVDGWGEEIEKRLAGRGEQG